MGIFSKLKKLFIGETTVDLDIREMKLISREEFKTPYGIGIREEYGDRNHTAIVTCTPPDER